MPVFEYVPANEEASQEAYFKMPLKDPESIEHAKKFLMKDVIVTHFEIRDISHLSSTEVQQLTEDAAEKMKQVTQLDPDHISAPIAKHSLLPLLEDQVLSDDFVFVNQDGLAIYSFDDGKIKLSYEELSPAALKGLTDDQEVYEQTIRGDFDTLAYAIQPVPPSKDYPNGMINHYSLGYMSEDGIYTPVVTVLDDQHPVIREIQNRTAPAQS
jgi:hypothetical protein